MKSNEKSPNRNLLTCILFIYSFFASPLFIKTVSAQPYHKTPVAVIFDSDIGPDYDDAGAITILHVLEDQGEAKILGTIASNKYEGIAAVMNVFNTYFNRPGIPIGVPKGDAVSIRDSPHWTDTILAKYPHKIKLNAEVPDALDVYRKILASQPDHSITIVTVGFLTNLANLLNTKGDRFSPLDGKALIEKKVKLLISMAGKFPKGKEFNLDQDVNSSKEVFGEWPTTIIYSGVEIGEKIKSGLPLIHNGNIHNNPAKDAFSICIPLAREDAEGRSSWDEITVLVAVRGSKRYYNLQSGKIKIDEDGSNSWDLNGKGQFYLVEKQSPQIVQNMINSLMMEIPKKR